MATWVAGALAGVAPEIMGIGPVAATKKVMARTGMKIEDFDVIEANEAFAAQSVAVQKELGFTDEQLNPNGGAIALGHPVGASGCRILVTLLHEMEAKDAKKGLATLCIGGGMGLRYCSRKRLSSFSGCKTPVFGRMPSRTGRWLPGSGSHSIIREDILQTM